MSGTFRVYCGHCQEAVLTGVGVLNDESSAALREHLRKQHPNMLHADNVALGDLLKHYDFRAETDA